MLQSGGQKLVVIEVDAFPIAMVNWVLGQSMRRYPDRPRRVYPDYTEFWEIQLVVIKRLGIGRRDDRDVPPCLEQ